MRRLLPLSSTRQLEQNRGSTKEFGLEPAAWEVEKVDKEGETRKVELVEKDTYVCAHERGETEPLFTADQIIDAVERLKHIDDRGNGAVLVEKLREEFTQDGGAE